jgi:hypothetical protein
MKHLKKFEQINEIKNTEQDVDFIIAKIKEKYPLQDVKKMFDDEIMEWIPDDEDISWYKNNNNGEAQDMIISIMIDWFEKNYNKISDDINDKVCEEIKNYYKFLKF